MEKRLFLSFVGCFVRKRCILMMKEVVRLDEGLQFCNQLGLVGSSWSGELFEWKWGGRGKRKEVDWMKFGECKQLAL